MKLILLVTLLAVLYTVDYSNSAAVRSEEFAEQLRRIVHDMYPDNKLIKRNTDGENDDQPKRNCYDSPCGWNTYIRATRRATLFTPNTCECPDKTYKCVRTGENVSMSAYVYHCRQNTTVDDIESELSSDDMDYVS